MTEKKAKYWQEPGWDPLSPRRKHPWRLAECSDWQDVLSTYECLVDEAGSPKIAPKVDPDEDG